MILNRFENRLQKAQNQHNSLHFLAYSINVDVATDKQRQELGFSLESPFHHIQGNYLDMSSLQYPGIHRPEAFISADSFGAPFGAHVEDFDLEAMNYIVKGAPKI